MNSVATIACKNVKEILSCPCTVLQSILNFWLSSYVCLLS